MLCIHKEMILWLLIAANVLTVLSYVIKSHCLKRKRVISPCLSPSHVFSVTCSLCVYSMQ